MKGKTELLTNFKFFSIPMVEMLQKDIQSLCNFPFLKIVKIESFFVNSLVYEFFILIIKNVCFFSKKLPS
jgi:hypothetical protein